MIHESFFEVIHFYLYLHGNHFFYLQKTIGALVKLQQMVKRENR